MQKQCTYKFPSFCFAIEDLTNSRACNARRKKNSTNLHKTATNRKPSLPSKLSNAGGLLSLLGCTDPVKSMNMEMSMLPVGSRVVKIEGPRSCLSLGIEKKSKGFLIPMSLDSHFKEKCNGNSNRAKFLRLKEFPNMKQGFGRGMRFNQMSDMEQRLLDTCKDSEFLDLRGYDCSQGKQDLSEHLVFAFKCNEAKSQSAVVEDIVLEETKSVYDLDGFVVVSRFLRDESILGIPNSLPTIATEVQGPRGFGNRSTTNSVGFCSFTGPKNTKATVPGPL